MKIPAPVFKLRKLWWLWIAMSLVLSAWLGYGLSVDKLDSGARIQARATFLPGQTTSGHYQIELACHACHGDEQNAGTDERETLQNACVNCHGAELKDARDAHPKSKFTDPRNAERAAKLDAAWCVTCHVEHKPQMTHAMGVTLPDDFCITCHADIAKDRPSHDGMAFNTCASAGCHNFHDNRALYEDFLLKHAQDPALTEKQLLPERNFAQLLHEEEFSDYPYAAFPLQSLQKEQADWPQADASEVVNEWFATAHAKAGVNCSACHQSGQETGENKTTWIEHPGQQICNTCHKAEVKGFNSGKHGMRVAQDLSPMTPAMARMPMRDAAHDKQLECTSCHSAHRFDIRTAAVDACLGCHQDQHSLAYKKSSHYALWQKEISGEAPANSGVSCASCHMPRVEFRTPDDVRRMLVQHNQNDVLRPNEKMIRPVCMQCHSLQTSLDALADRHLIEANFSFHPLLHTRSIDMSVQRETEIRQTRSEKRDRDE